MKNRRFPAEYATLNDDQKYAFQALAYGYDSGKNYFLTGDAGTGKSYLIDVFTKYCDINNINLLKCAPTGVAATAIGGVTMHRLFKLPLTVLTDRIEGSQYANMYKTLVYADIIFIDEVSMARVDAFGNAMAQIRAASQYRAKNGKNPIQVILCGDFGQLMPVITQKDRELYAEVTGRDIGNGCCYNSHWWAEFDFQPILLSQPMRQSDPGFCKALDNLKIGVKTDMDYLNQNSADKPQDGGIWLCGYNNTAAEKNALGIYNLPGELYESDAEVTGKANVKQTNFAEKLLYKVGARVVMCMQAPRNGGGAMAYHNGSLGTITARSRSGDGVYVKLDSGLSTWVNKIDLPFYDYTVHDGRIQPVEIGHVCQFPFKIGYAVTIHKAQGQTYDKMNLVPEIFMAGQLYVAMSRCKELGKIYIQPDAYGLKITPDKIRANMETVKFLIDTDAKSANFKNWFMGALYDRDAG